MNYTDLCKAVEEGPDTVLQDALRRIPSSVKPEVIQYCQDRSERHWMDNINTPLLIAVFGEEAWSGLISVSADELWTGGRDQEPERPGRNLGNPKPDFAWGIGLATDKVTKGLAAWDPLSWIALDAMRANQASSFCFSPASGHRSDVVFPGLIYEAKKGTGDFDIAEAQALLGAARALALLERLRHVSGVSSEDPVVAVLTSVGPVWRCYFVQSKTDETGAGSLVAYRRSARQDFNVETAPGTVRLLAFLLRLKGWLIKDHQGWIRKHTSAAWAAYLHRAGQAVSSQGLATTED